MGCENCNDPEQWAIVRLAVCSRGKPYIAVVYALAYAQSAAPGRCSAAWIFEFDDGLAGNSQRWVATAEQRVQSPTGTESDGGEAQSKTGNHERAGRWRAILGVIHAGDRIY